MTLPDRLEEHAIAANHLTPRLLGEELALFRKIKGYLPTVMPIHLSPQYEDEIKGEVERVARKMEITITVAHEGMRLTL